jgi:hypothetical protein
MRLNASFLLTFGCKMAVFRQTAVSGHCTEPQKVHQLKSNADIQ